MNNDNKNSKLDFEAWALIIFVLTGLYFDAQLRSEHKQPDVEVNEYGEYEEYTPYDHECDMFGCF